MQPPVPSRASALAAVVRFLLPLAALALPVACGGDTPTGAGAVASVSIEGADPTLHAIGAEATLQAVARDRGGHAIAGVPIAWASLDEDVAIVNAAGTVQARGDGSARIVASAGGHADTATVTIAQAATATALSLGDFVLARGDTARVAAVRVDQNGVPTPDAPPAVSWATSDATVATVDQGGLVRGVAAGTAHITASDGGQAVGSLTVTVAPATTSVTFASISAGLRHACALTASGVAYCWGDNASGQLGVGAACAGAPCRVATPVAGGLAWRDVSAGGAHSCGITLGSHAYCWGANGHGELGDTVASQSAPVAVSGGFTFSQVSASVFDTVGHSCALNAGRVFCWGANALGQLGDGTGRDGPTPRAVKTSLTFASVHTGGQYSCALRTTNALHCWGDDRAGQLGDGGHGADSVPTLAASARHFSVVSTAGDHACGLDASDGTAWCWGAGVFGAEGGRPAPVLGGLAFHQLAVGLRHACALTSSGVAYCWGGGATGVLGSGVTASVRPVRVSTGRVFATIAAGGDFTCARTAAGAVYCWGANDVGQLGAGSTAASSALPVRVGQ